MEFVDGFVVPMPRAHLERYRGIAQRMGEIWREHGALAYVECAGDDLPFGELTSFPRSVQVTEDETVVFAWIVYPSREVRDEVNRKVMADPRVDSMSDPDLFDGRRMIFGGFRKIVDIG